MTKPVRLVSICIDLTRSPDEGLALADHLIAPAANPTEVDISATPYLPIGVGVGSRVLDKAYGVAVAPQLVFDIPFRSEDRGMLGFLRSMFDSVREPGWSDMWAYAARGCAPAFFTATPNRSTLGLICFFRACWEENGWLPALPKKPDAEGIKRDRQRLERFREMANGGPTDMKVPDEILRLYERATDLPLEIAIQALETWLGTRPRSGADPRQRFTLDEVIRRSTSGENGGATLHDLAIQITSRR